MDTKQTKPAPYAPSVVQGQMMPAMTNLIGQVTRARPGQPTKRTPEAEAEILDRIACGESLVAVCQDDHLPGYSTFNRWCRDDPKLLEQVDIAYEFHARTLDDIADDMLAGGVTSTGNVIRDKERAAHMRWRLGKLNRRRYGEKVQVDHVETRVFVLPNDVIDGDGY